MSDEADKLWNEVVAKLRKRQGFCPLTPKEAAAAYEAAPVVPLSEDRIKEIADVAMDKQPDQGA